jgi:hypothetical protein
MRCRLPEIRNRLCSTKELALHCQGKIHFDEPIPGLFFFARSEEPGNTIGLFIFCLAGIKWEGGRSTHGNPQKVIVEYGPLGPFLERHFIYLS